MTMEVPKTLIDAVYLRLRPDIINGNLAPNSKLRIKELKVKYETSASPLREALNRLAGEGFVHASGQKGFRVVPVSNEDLEDITRMRIRLECDALSESIEKGDDVWESNIIAAYHRLTRKENLIESNFLEWEKCNSDFHKALISACSSKWLLRFRHILYGQHKRYRFMSIFISHDKTRDVHKEHEAIKNAAIARNVERACEETTKHIQRTLNLAKSNPLVWPGKD